MASVITPPPADTNGTLTVEKVDVNNDVAKVDEPINVKPLSLTSTTTEPTSLPESTRAVRESWVIVEKLIGVVPVNAASKLPSPVGSPPLTGATTINPVFWMN